MTTSSDNARELLDSTLKIESSPALDVDTNVPDLIDTVEDRVKLVADKLFIFDERAWFLAAMFNPSFYASNYGLTELEETSLFAHFLNEGIDKNYSPSPAFDPEYTLSLLPELELDEDGEPINSEPTFTRWLKEAYTDVEPHALFDSSFYLDLYADLADTVKNAYAHFATTGLYENRIPCKFLQLNVNAVYSNFDETPADMVAIFSSIPVGCSAAFARKETQVIMQKIFMPELYKRQLEIEDEKSIEHLYSHFLVTGCHTSIRPTVLFNETWYLEQLSNYELADKPTDTLREYKTLSAQAIEEHKILGTCSPFLHWFFKGMKLDIVPTPLFETDHYITAHPDIRNNWNSHPFMHFVETGYKEPFRRFSVMFDTNYYTQQVKKLNYNNALLDFTLRGQFDEASAVSGLRLEHFSAEDPLTYSSLELAASYFKRRTAKLESPTINAMVEKATRLEPQLVRPYGARLIRLAPLFHPETDLMHDSRKVVKGLVKNQYDVIILMPHCRMAGSANVAGQFTKTVSQLVNGESVLVITTDLSAFERADWFPSNVDVFDISENTFGLRQERKIRILLDLVRGLRPKKLVNINSNLGWHLTKTFGKQLSSWMDIYFYLFCWDRDVKGNKGGYPIQWFLPTFNYCKTVFTDNTVLRSELQSRYCLTDAMRKKIVTLHTPVAEKSVNYHNALMERSKNTGVRRVFWSGRFDRQKRIDVLLAVAERMPDTEFWVWGKEVLNDSEVTMDSAPSNIRTMGTYQSIDDLPIASCDCFLYTSGWDGLPIILIDVASRGIPIVASSVGGVGDLVTDDTGWPVEDYAEPEAYCNAINNLLEDYPAALTKAQRGRDHALELCNTTTYRQTLKDAMALEELRNASTEKSAAEKPL